MSCCGGNGLKDADPVNKFFYKAFPKAKFSLTLNDCTQLTDSIPKECKIDYSEVIQNSFVTEWYDGKKKDDWLTTKATKLVLEKNKMIPCDEDARWKSIDEARKYLKDKFEAIMPTSASYPVWDDDQATIDFCTLHIGLFFLAKNEDGNYEVDLLFLKDFEMRGGYHPWGAKLVMDSKAKKILSVQVLDKEYKKPKAGAKSEVLEAWEVAKLRFRCSVAVAVTAKAHLIEIHWCTAGPLAINCRTHLAWNNPLRYLLEPFHFNTPQINFAAQSSLFSPNGFLERSFPIKLGEFTAMAGLVKGTYKAMSPMQFVAKNDIGDLDTPKNNEGVLLWNAFRKFAIGMLKPYTGGASASADGSDDDGGDVVNASSFGEFSEEMEAWEAGMRDHLGVDVDEMTFLDIVTFSMYAVSALHEALGTVGHEQALFAPPVTCPGETMLEAYPGKNLCYIMCLLASFTNFTLPLISGDLTIVYKKPEVEGPVKALMKDLQDIIFHVDEVNKGRSRATPMFNPRNMEMSVSV